MDITSRLKTDRARDYYDDLCACLTAQGRVDERLMYDPILAEAAAAYDYYCECMDILEADGPVVTHTNSRHHQNPKKNPAGEEAGKAYQRWMGLLQQLQMTPKTAKDKSEQAETVDDLLIDD